MKFQLTATEGTVNITQTFEEDSLDAVVEHFDSFVRGCGFFPKGEIKVVPDQPDFLEVEKAYDFAHEFFSET